MPADEKLDTPATPKTEAPKELSDADHHAELTKRHDVILVRPAVTVRGRVFAEQRTEPGEVQLVSLKCVVAHRVLHGMSPDEVKALRDAFEAKHPLEKGQPDDEKRATAFEHFALKHIAKHLGEVPDFLSLEKHIVAHAHDGVVKKHRKAALAALSAG